MDEVKGLPADTQQMIAEIVGETPSESVEEIAVSEPVENEEKPVDTESEAGEPAVLEGAEESAEGDEPVEGEEASPAEYTPNFKYAVKDQELEMDEWARPFINKDNEEKFRELYTRAAGLDAIKTQRDELKTQFDTASTDYTKIKEVNDGLEKEQAGWKYAENILSKGDYPSFLALLHSAGVNEEKLAYALAARMEMSPEQRQMEVAQTQQSQQFNDLQADYTKLEGKLESQSQETFNTNLQMALNQPQAQEAMKRYNTALGDEKGFWNEIAKEGIQHKQVNGTELPVAQAVANVVQRVNKLVSPAEAQSQTNASGEKIPTKVRQVVKGQENTIPNVGHSNANSPIVKRFKGDVFAFEKYAEKELAKSHK